MAQITGTDTSDRLEGGSGSDTISGLGGDDTLLGGGGADQLIGGDGDDDLDGGFGDDILVGGAGYDSFSDSLGGNDHFVGGLGSDFFAVSRASGLIGQVVIDGGAGDDYAYVSGVSTSINARLGDGNDRVSIIDAKSLSVDLGAGDDEIRVFGDAGRLKLILGEGDDHVILSKYFHSGQIYTPNSLILRDFEAGAAGDRFTLDDYLVNQLQNWDTDINPFSDGHLRLKQSGSDVLLQVDLNGGGDQWSTIIDFQNTERHDFRTVNLGGYDPSGASLALSLTGDASSETLQGGSGSDTISGLGGDDTLLGAGGADQLLGGDGDDDLDGGFGDDILIGGSGNDDFSDTLGGKDRFIGGLGFDYFNVSRSDEFTGRVVIDGGAGDDLGSLSGMGSNVIARMGDGDDSFWVSFAKGVALDMGAGDDEVRLGAEVGRVKLTLGAGADHVSLGAYFNGGQFIAPTTILVSDFETGATGDSFILDDYLASQLEDWDNDVNPFSDGHLRLVQNESSTLLQVDLDGGGDQWSTLIDFQNTERREFVAANFDGYDPDRS